MANISEIPTYSSGKTEIKCPLLGSGLAEGLITRWFAALGETVQSGKHLVEIETDHATLVVPAPVTGLLESINFHVGDAVRILEVLGTIQEPILEEIFEENTDNDSNIIADDNKFIFSKLRDIDKYMTSIDSNIFITKDYHPKIKDEEYGDIDEYDITVLAERNLTDLNDKEKCIYRNMLLLHSLNFINDIRLHEFEFGLAYNDGKNGGPTSWTLPKDVEPDKLFFPRSLTHTLGDALSSISSVQKEYIDYPISKILSSIFLSGISWLSLDDILKSAVFDTEQTDFSLFVGNISDDQSPLHYNGEMGLITIAPPGSGKTQCNVLPALSHYRGAVIALDIKGECFINTAEWRRDNVGPVIYFSPTTPDTSARYNPLAFVSENSDNVWEDSRFLAELLIVPQNVKEPGWEAQGQHLLTLLIAFVVLTKPIEQRHMVAILDLVAGIELDELLEAVGAAETPFPSPMRRAAVKFHKMQQSAPKQFEGVLSGASQHLTVWEGSGVERVTSGCDWEPEQFRSSPPLSLYLCIPPNAIETYAPLLRVIIAQHVRHLMREEPSRDAPPILFMLDELPRLGRMEPIREALEVGRSYGIKLWMFAQYLGQLREVYGQQVADGMVNITGIQIYMNPGNDIAHQLSKDLGYKESILDGKRYPLAEASELTGPEFADDQIVFSSSHRPARVRKVFFHATNKT